MWLFRQDADYFESGRRDFMINLIVDVPKAPWLKSRRAAGSKWVIFSLMISAASAGSWIQKATRLNSGSPPRRQEQRRRLNAALDHHLFDFRNCLGGVQSLRARVRAIHDRVAAIKPERIF